MHAAGFFRVMIGTKSFFCFRPILHVLLKVMPHTAHRLSLLSATRSSSIITHLARSSTVHVESSDNMRSHKAQCQAPPDNPETGDTYRSRERSCADEKIEHQNVYKRHSSIAKTYVDKRGRFPQTRDLWRKSVSMGYRVGRVSLHRLKVVAVAGLRWIYFVVCFFSVWWDFVFFFRFLYFERTRPTASTKQPCLMYLSLLVPGCVQGVIT